MIDTDKYEGHTEGPWYMRNHYNSEAPSVAAGKYDHLLAICGHGPKPTHKATMGINKPPEEQKANAQLIADAPLLLAEVKRLRDELKQANHFLRDIRDGLIADRDWVYINEHLGDEEE